MKLKKIKTMIQAKRSTVHNFSAAGRPLFTFPVEAT